MLSRDNILEAIAKGEVEIYPFNRRNLTGIGYNLTTTDFAFSISEGNLLTVRERVTSAGAEHYVMIPPNDTVLLFSKEYIAVTRELAGTFHSKVSCVCQGLGHVSTTLDPTWRGQLIISVNNPTKDSIELVLDGKPGNILTMLLYRLDTPVTGPNIHDNNQGRCDLLLSRLSGPPKRRKWRKDYYALREFIVSRYADSLNGYDSFLGSDAPSDRYSVRVDLLRSVRDRLERDRAWVIDRSYLSDNSSMYNSVKTLKEEDALRECSLFQVLESIDRERCDRMLAPIEVWCDETQGEVLERIDFCLRAIEYELKAIDHQRRIEWQNSKVLEFAGADTEYAKARRRQLQLTFMRDHAVILIAIIFTIIGLICANVLSELCDDSPLCGNLATLCISCLCALIPILGKDWVNHRRQLHEWPSKNKKND